MCARFLLHFLYRTFVCRLEYCRLAINSLLIYSTVILPPSSDLCKCPDHQRWYHGTQKLLLNACLFWKLENVKLVFKK